MGGGGRSAAEGFFVTLFTKKDVKGGDEEGLGALFFLGLISLGEVTIGEEIFLFSVVAEFASSLFRFKFCLGLVNPLEL